MSLPFGIDLTGKTAVITGGGGVLCASFAKDVAACGASVVVVDINEAAAQTVAGEINKSGGKAIAAAANCLDRASLEQAREKAEKAFGPCDILINGAGGNHPKGCTDGETLTEEALSGLAGRTFFDLEPDAIRFVFDLNVLAAVLTTQVFAHGMAEKGDGIILNVSSMNAFRPLTKIPAYSAAKAAVSNFTQWLAVHFAPRSVRVNAIAPGFFVTNQNRDLLFDKATGQPTERAAKIIAHTPQARFGDPGDLTGTLLWLLSPEASGFVTGVVVPVDGGFSAYSGV
jgi:NAD(P)-dependent dehydrogenase (short-subunit alcohol dehydrogenase family)